MFDAFGVAAQATLSAAALPGNYRRNRESGQAPVGAGADAAFDAAAATLLNPLTYVAGMAGRGLALAAYRGFRDRDVTLRAMRTPFSQRFSHTETTARLQAYALGRMGAGGLGTEAARLYGSYGR